MARKKNTPAPQTDSVQQTAVDIPVQDLKTRFQARSIPLETDFADLIDVADCGRKAVGLSPDVTPVLDTGLTLDSATGQLRIKSAQNGGVITDNSGLKIKTSTANGLGVSDDNNVQIAISLNKSGLVLREDGLSVEDDYYVKIMAGVHGATFYALHDYGLILCTGHKDSFYNLYFYGRNAWQFIKTTNIKLKDNAPEAVFSKVFPDEYEIVHEVLDFLQFRLEEPIADGDVITGLEACCHLQNSSTDNITITLRSF